MAQAKQKRPYANVTREDVYGNPPPLKRQMLEASAQRQLRSPTKTVKASSIPQRTTRPVVRERPAQQQPRQQTHDDSNIERIRQWQLEYQARFPKMVFYFESISEDLRVKLSKQAISLGAVRHNPVFPRCNFI